MGYLHPPPGDAPVIVMKDVGGDVRQYAAQTYAYIQSGREVRLHECRSACTLALAVPNVCVYSDSVLRFHKAYNPITRATNDGVSDAMMWAYPPAVRTRLGVLTRQYKSLTGSELIRLGVRDCNTPASPKILVARANVRPIDSGNPLANAFGGMMAGLGAPNIPVYSGYNPPVRIQPVKVQVAEATPISPEAPRVDAPNVATESVAAGEPAAVTTPTEAPVPPPRPSELAAMPVAAAKQTERPPLPAVHPLATVTPRVNIPAWDAPIRGAAPVLASARFAPFPYRIIRKG